MSDISSIFKAIETRLDGNKCFNLLYKADVDVDVEEFHLLCDSKGPTVTILYGKYNTFFGGYTSQSWSSDNMKLKKDEKAFLFFKSDTAKEECVFMPINKRWEDRAITCDKDHGPTFGGGTWKWENYDLQTFRKEKYKKKYEGKDGFIQLNGYMSIGCAYDIEKQALSARKEDIRINELIVRQVEVYQVLDDLLKEPWRKQPSDEETEAMKTRLENLEPIPGLGIRQYNILLVGKIGSGKSSFFNTLASVFKGEIKTNAPARSADRSTTNEVHAYELRSKDDKRLSLRIFDIRGFDTVRAVDHELRLLVDGRLPVGYQFPELSAPVKENEIKSSTLDDEIHLVCFVAGASTLDTLIDTLRNEIEDIQKIVSNKGLPMVVVATKVDKLFPKISEDADRAYTSSIVCDAVKKISDHFGVQTTHIFPVENYVNDSEIKPGKNRLALEALDTMAKLITDYLEQHSAMPKYVDAWYGRRIELSITKHEHEKQKVLTQIGAKLKTLNEKQLRVLCIGAVCSGKTSFIDSMASALRDEIYSKASVGYGAGKTIDDSHLESTTEKFQMYQMKYKHDSGELCDSNVYIGDTPGVQEVEGMQLDDIKFVIQGHVPNRLRIKKGIKKESKKFKQRPEKKDRVHCVCFVFDISARNDLPKKLQDTFLSLQKWLREKGIPYVVIITKGDLLSKAVRDCKLCVFEDHEIKKRKDKLISMFDFKENRIFPVINYTHEDKVVPESDALLIEAFDKIRKYGEEYLVEIENEETDVNDE